MRFDLVVAMLDFGFRIYNFEFILATNKETKKVFSLNRTP